MHGGLRYLEMLDLRLVHEALTERGLWVLTALDGGEAELTARGAPFGPLD